MQTSLIKSDGLRLSFFSVAGNIFATALSAIALIAITRLLGPHKFGIFSFGFSLALLLVKINDFGINTALIKLTSVRKSNDDNNRFYSLAIYYKLILSLIISVIGITATFVVNQFYVTTDIYIILIACTLGLATAYYEQILIIFQSQQMFKFSVYTNFIQASIKLAALILFFITSVKNVYIIFSTYMLTPLIATIAMSFRLPHWFKVSWHSNDTQASMQMKAVVKHSSVALISAGFIENIDILFVYYYLNEYETGLYGGAMRIAQLFALAAYYFGDVLNPRVANYNNKKDVDDYTKKAFSITLLSILCFLLLLPAIPFLINSTIGTEYNDAKLPLVLLLAASFLKLASMPFIALFYSYSKYWTFSVVAIAQLIIILFGNYFLVPSGGVLAAAGIKAASQLCLFLSCLVITRYLYVKKFETSN